MKKTLVAFLCATMTLAWGGLGSTTCVPGTGAVWAEEGDAKALLEKAKTLADEQRLDEAAQLCTEVLQKEPGNPGALFQMGWICNERHQYEESIKYLQQLGGRAENAHEVWCELGFAYRKLVRVEEAKRAYEKACQAKDDYPRAWLGLADVLYVLKKDYIGASRAYEKALSLSPRNAIASYRLGWCLNDDGRPAKALPFLQQAVRLEPKYQAALVELSFCWLKLGKPKDALECSHKALLLEKNSVLAHYYAGQAYARLKQTSKAHEEIRILKKLSPERAKKLETFLKTI